MGEQKQHRSRTAIQQTVVASFRVEGRRAARLVADSNQTWPEEAPRLTLRYFVDFSANDSQSVSQGSAEGEQETPGQSA